MEYNQIRTGVSIFSIVQRDYLKICWGHQIYFRASLKTLFQLKRPENLLYYCIVVKCDAFVKSVLT